MKGKYPGLTGLLPKLAGRPVDLRKGKGQLHINKSKPLRYSA
jgi:hypothetical protein